MTERRFVSTIDVTSSGLARFRDVLAATRGAEIIVASAGDRCAGPDLWAVFLRGLRPIERRPTIVVADVPLAPSSGPRGFMERVVVRCLRVCVRRFAVRTTADAASFAQNWRAPMEQLRVIGPTGGQSERVDRLVALSMSLGPHREPRWPLAIRLIRAPLRMMYRRYRMASDPRFAELRHAASGMLPHAGYRRIYQAVVDIPGDFDVIEVGVGGAAGTVSMAWALQDTDRSSKVIAVERMVGGSRAAVGDLDANVELVTATLERFGVAEQVELLIHDLDLSTGSAVLDRVASEQIGGFVHDADGRIDRDFQLFWKSVVPGGMIVIDDVSSSEPKARVTRVLLDQFSAWGLFELDEVVGDTAFGRKPHHADWSRFDAEACRRIVERHLV